MAVVDERLRVHGIAGLRIADAAIMPTVIAGNTNIPCITVGEKCAEMILADAADRAVQSKTQATAFRARVLRAAG